MVGNGDRSSIPLAANFPAIVAASIENILIVFLIYAVAINNFGMCVLYKTEKII